MGTVGYGVNPNNASNRENRIEMEVVKPKTWLLIAKVEPQAWDVKSRCWLKAMGQKQKDKKRRDKLKYVVWSEIRKAYKQETEDKSPEVQGNSGNREKIQEWKDFSKDLFPVLELLTGLL